MPLFTSTHFASACANGTDWRDTSKNILEKLEGARSQEDPFNLGFLYISDHLADDATSILNLFKSVLNIDNWVGSIGMGVLGCGESYIDQPSISAMIGRFPDNSFCIFPQDTSNDGSQENLFQDKVEKWITHNSPMLTIVHSDPMADKIQQETLIEMEKTINCFIVGGITSSRSQHYQIANNVCENSLCGVFFSEDIPVSTALSQGCQVISPFRTITKSDDNIILELDNKRALDVFQNDLRERGAQKMNKKPEDFTTDLKSIETSDEITSEYKPLFQGHIHVALPLSLSDQKDYLVRNIVNIDADEGSISISENVNTGSHIVFVERDELSMMADLSHSLISLRKRVQAERGSFEPKGALYISCVGRATSVEQNNEVSLIRDIIGDIPMTGFYAGGEINNARLYGYTGILTLFF